MCTKKSNYQQDGKEIWILTKEKYHHHPEKERDATKERSNDEN